MKFVNTFDKHRQEPDKPLEVYTRELRLQLGEELKHCKKIYLDTNYWVRLRDVILGRQTNKHFDSLLGVLRAGVQTGKLICPISDEIFSEILLQSDASTLRASVSLIDDLSKGIILLPSVERIQFEILYFIRCSSKGRNSVYHPDIFVWSKIALIHGAIHPTSTPLSPEEELVMQKAFFDHRWSMSLTDIVNVMGMDNIINMPRHKDIAKELNANKVKFAHENNSFKEIFLSEIAGVIDLFQPLFEEALVYLFEKEKGRKPTEAELAEAKAGKHVANLIYHAFKNDNLEDYFPSLVIGAGLHASVRHDVKRKFRANDLADFRHAQAALPYYNYFFTEHNLRDMVCRNNIRFDNKYNCTVLSEPQEAISYLEKMK